MNTPKSVLKTGANRGIGFGMVKEFLKDSKVEHVFATVRNLQHSQGLSCIKDTRLHVLTMDVNCDESIQVAYEKVSAMLKGDGLNALINNAGILIDYPYLNGEKPNRKEVNEIFDTNSTSPLVVTQVFLPLLRKVADPSDFGAHRAAVINISSGLGSMGGYIDTTTHSDRKFLIYRMSKAALNMMMKTLSIDLAPEGILVMSICPGWVSSDMGGPHATTTVDHSTTCILNLIRKVSKEDCGTFYDALEVEKYLF